VKASKTHSTRSVWCHQFHNKSEQSESSCGSTVHTSNNPKDSCTTSSGSIDSKQRAAYSREVYCKHKTANPRHCTMKTATISADHVAHADNKAASPGLQGKRPFVKASDHYLSNQVSTKPLCLLTAQNASDGCRTQSFCCVVSSVHHQASSHGARLRVHAVYRCVLSHHTAHGTHCTASSAHHAARNPQPVSIQLASNNTRH
jgi:hypothetical protein